MLGLNVSSRRAKRGSRVHEHGVEEARRRAARARSSSLGVAADEDVAQAAGGERAHGARLLEQRHDLAGELRAPEREQLDEHDLRLHAAERHQDAAVAELPRAVEVAVAGAEAVALHAERRERDELDAVRRVDALGQVAAGEQHDLEALREPVAQRVGAHQVAEADRVLAVEEQRGLHADHRRDEVRAGFEQLLEVGELARAGSG